MCISPNSSKNLSKWCNVMRENIVMNTSAVSNHCVGKWRCYDEISYGKFVKARVLHGTNSFAHVWVEFIRIYWHMYYAMLCYSSRIRSQYISIPNCPRLLSRGSYVAFMDSSLSALKGHTNVLVGCGFEDISSGHPSFNIAVTGL